jgi:FkbM family methyltransferase
LPETPEGAILPHNHPELGNVGVIKRLAKYLIRSAVPRLPGGVRQALLDAFCATPDGAAELLARLAPQLGITEFGSNGDYGLIRSVSSDIAILPTYAQRKAWSRGINALLIDFFRERGGTYFDVGANIGLTTIPVAQNPLVKCLAFEPEPANFAHLADNVSRNAKHGNVELHPIAILDSRRTVILGVAEGNIGDHRIGFDDDSGRRTVEVFGIPLDEFYDCVTGSLAIKMDIQGAEPLAIIGGRKTLMKAELVIMEFWPHGMRAHGGDPESVIEFISGFSKVAFTNGEEEKSLTWLSPSMASAELRQFVRERGTRGKDARAYIDVIGRR